LFALGRPRAEQCFSEYLKAQWLGSIALAASGGFWTTREFWFMDGGDQNLEGKNAHVMRVDACMTRDGTNGMFWVSEVPKCHVWD